MGGRSGATVRFAHSGVALRHARSRVRQFVWRTLPCYWAGVTDVMGIIPPMSFFVVPETNAWPARPEDDRRI